MNDDMPYPYKTSDSSHLAELSAPTSCCSTGSPGVTQIDNAGPTSSDPVTRPAHYTNHPSGIEAIELTQHMTFCLGNVVKYVMRAGLKGDAVEDLRKARTYLDYEITRIEGHWRLTP